MSRLEIQKLKTSKPFDFAFHAPSFEAQSFQNLRASKPLCLALHAKSLQVQSLKTLYLAMHQQLLESTSRRTLVPSDAYKTFANVSAQNPCGSAARRVPCLKTLAYSKFFLFKKSLKPLRRQGRRPPGTTGPAKMLATGAPALGALAPQAPTLLRLALPSHACHEHETNPKPIS